MKQNTSFSHKKTSHNIPSEEFRNKTASSFMSRRFKSNPKARKSPTINAQQLYD